MDVESRNFKAYQQVPKWWSVLMTAGVISALLVAIIALAVGSAAMKEANDNSNSSQTVFVDDDQDVAERRTTAVTNAPETPTETPVETPVETPDETTTETPAGTGGGNGMMESDRALPGSENYTGFTHQPRPRAGRYYDIVTHGHVSNTYFALLQKGIDDAAQQLGVDVLYLDAEDPDETASHTAIIENILNARRSLKDGLAVSFMEHTPELGRELNEAAIDLPVMSMLLDEDAYEGLEINTFANLGFSYQISGARSARLFEDRDIQRPLCLLNAEAIFGQETACDALLEAMTDGVALPNTESADVASAIEENNIDAILTVGPGTFETAYAYLEENDLLCSNDSPSNDSNCIVLATFGESEQILNGIVEGSVTFAMDDQLYLQGYLTVLFLFVRSFFGHIPGSGRSVLTGPVLIDTVEEAERRLSRDIMAGQTIRNRTAADLDIRFVVHGKTSDPFWSSVKAGVRAAARGSGVPIDFRHADSDATSMEAVIESHVRMINEATDDNVDGLIVTLPRNDSSLAEALQEYRALTGNRVITITAGHAWFMDLPIEAHIGMAETFEGSTVAERLEEANVRRKLLCVIAEQGNEELEARCESLRGNNTELEVVVLDSTEDQDFHADMNNRVRVIRDAVVDALNNDEDIQAVVSTGLLATEGCRDALDLLDAFCEGNDRPRNNRNTCTEFVAYDIDPKIFTYIKNDELLFAVDQQPALQGFLPVYLAMIDALYANPPFGIILTGPRFVDLSNVEIAEIEYGFLTT